jgi:hydrogenase large subunit
MQRQLPPANGQHAINLVHAVENIADHITHFYLFFMPDFARATYADEPWHEGAAMRFTALKGTAATQMLPARAGLMNMMGILAGNGRIRSRSSRADRRGPSRGRNRRGCG